MPETEIQIDESQRQYLEALRSQLADEHVGEYGHVRMRDALQYLIDQHEAGDADFTAPDTARDTHAMGSDTQTTDSADSEQDRTTASQSESSSRSADESQSPNGSTAQSADPDDRLQCMMGLLDQHDDAWEETDTDEGKYVVTLPDGTTEHVRTKDDVRALLFKHYD